MPLKDSFYATTSGLQQQLLAAFNAGVSLVGSGPGVGQYNAIKSGLDTAAAAGNTVFTVNIPSTYNSATVRANNGNNLIAKVYLDGIKYALATSDIYSYECAPTLNLTDAVNVSIDLKFTF